MAAGIWRFVRTACYVALGLAILGIAALTLPFALDYCRDGGAGQVVCDGLAYQKLFESGFAIIMFGAYTGVPAGLAAGGVGFLVRDLIAWVRN